MLRTRSWPTSRAPVRSVRIQVVRISPPCSRTNRCARVRRERLEADVAGAWGRDERRHRCVARCDHRVGIRGVEVARGVAPDVLRRRHRRLEAGDRVREVARVTRLRVQVQAARRAGGGDLHRSRELDRLDRNDLLDDVALAEKNYDGLTSGRFRKEFSADR